MRIAILGAGFAGLATTWHLLRYTKGAATIDLFDPEPIGKGVSGLSSGLLHAYAGKHARRLWQADKGMDATHQLITEASRGLNQSVILSKGILRPAITEEQIEDFQKSSKLHSETEWWDEEKCKKIVPGLLTHTGGLFIKNGLTIDVPSYLNGLWQACALLGTQFHQTALIEEKQLRKFDCIVFALGYAIKGFKLFESLPIKPIKGQTIELKWPVDLPPLPFSIVSSGYLAMGKEKDKCLAGATFEREFKTIHSEPEIAIPLIKEKICPFFPSLKNAEVISCRAGIRAAAPTHNHLPFAGQVGPKMWYIAGLGSKGLLYHAWLGDLLAQAILKNDQTIFPSEILYPLWTKEGENEEKLQQKS